MIPQEALPRIITYMLLNYKYLIKWYAQNTLAYNHFKIVQMPIGLDYHTITENPSHSWKLLYELPHPRNQENVIVNVKSNAVPFYERIPKIYVNFSMKNDKFKQRELSIATINPELLAISNTFMPRTLVWNNIAKYAFVLSPFGNGMDCHRTWEVLCLGSIPIVKAPHFKNLFENLPVLNVNEWSDVNNQLLLDTIQIFKNTIFNYDKLTLTYWTNLFKI
jgi:hypothetical protein